MRIATWNVNSLKVRLLQVEQLILNYDIDVLALQELKLSSELFPLEAFTNLGYSCIVNGQKTYNGVALISRLPMSDIIADMPDFVDNQKRVISAVINGIKFINVYCVNGQSLTSEKFQYKQLWFKNLINYIKSSLLQNEKLIVLGDFNIAPNDIDIYDVQKWNGQILSSPAERKIYKDILDLGLIDIVRAIKPNDKIYTWWDYRQNSFKRNLGLRIDHILISNFLSPTLVSYNVLKGMRSVDKPSDHAPFLMDINVV